MDLRFTIFRDRPVIARSATIRNVGSAPADLRCAMSLAVDLPDADWILLGLAGAWARERHVVERRLVPGRQSASSTRGASSAHHNPFLALRRPATDEAHGEAYGFSLVYSGNFLAEAEVEPFGTTRVRLGIEPDTFGWRLEPGASFGTPEAIVAYSDAGLGALSDAFHGLFRERLARGQWRDRPRPVLINNWEATYFDFDADKLVRIAASAQDLGVELFVLDDGWFGKRDDDTTSLGDWVVDRRKLPDGIDGVAERITALGMGFGIWIEPEMVSAESDLFRAHPDWAIGIPGRPRTESRQQLVLDMARPEVVDHLTDGPDGGPRERADHVRQVGHEPQHHRAVVGVAAARPAGRVLPPLHPRGVRAVPAADHAIPGDPLRVVRQRRRPVRPRAARLRAAGLDERRDRRGRAAADPVGDVAGVSAELDGGPRLGRARTTRSGGSRRSRPARPSRSSASSATSSTRRR